MRLAHHLVSLTFAALAFSALAPAQSTSETHSEEFAKVFDEHWQRFADQYPYFEFYGVDWDAERAEHRPRAVAATDASEFVWELARLLCSFDDPHVEFMPPKDLLTGWAIPDLRTDRIDRKIYVLEWGDHQPTPPAAFADEPFASPEILTVEGTPIGSGTPVLAAGPVGTNFELLLRWPDGTETTETVRRPVVSNLPPPKKHLGEDWVAHSRVGSIGYLRIGSFNPEACTLGPDGKITTALRARLRELLDTDAMILDLQDNSGGLVAASDPFLSHFLERSLSYKWGRSGGRRRSLAPRSPRYRGQVVAIVDEDSASGGEWAARILRDAGRAVVIGGPSCGAEAAVKKSLGSDGSEIQYSAWPIAGDAVSFQYDGIEIDHPLPLTIEAVREFGIDEAEHRVKRARLALALELLGGSPDLLDELAQLAR